MSDVSESTHVRTRGPRLLAVVAVVAVLLVCGGVYQWQQARAGHGMLTWLVPEADVDFPALDTAALDPVQQRIVDVARTEYDDQPDGTKYAEGVEESWCADFVSWVMNEAGVPLSNPNSGSWRIPGVYTLTDYYIAENRFRPADSDYRPSTGDVLLYAPESRFGQHTNIVLRIDGDVMTTVGGNERGKIRVDEVPRSTPHLVGYGLRYSK